MIEVDPEGNFKRGQFRTREEAEAAIERLRKKGRLSDTAKLTIVEEPETRLENLEVELSFNPQLRRTLLKMAISLASLLPDFHNEDVQEGRLYLMHDANSDTVNCMRLDGMNAEKIDCLRKPLNHVIYVERVSSTIQAAVQLFGGIQMFCFLGRCSDTKKDDAVLAVLDPINGDEEFESLSPLGFVFPMMTTEKEHRRTCANRIGQMMNDANERGAKNLTFTIESIDLI